jgi:hypothetical protein
MGERLSRYGVWNPVVCFDGYPSVHWRECDGTHRLEAWDVMQARLVGDRTEGRILKCATEWVWS